MADGARRRLPVLGDRRVLAVRIFGSVLVAAIAGAIVGGEAVFSVLVLLGLAAGSAMALA